MTAISLSSSNNSTTTLCSFIKCASPKKLTRRLIWTVIVTIFLCFWTFLLYCYTSQQGDKNSLIISNEKYSPIVSFSSQEQQQKAFDLLIKSEFINLYKPSEINSNFVMFIVDNILTDSTTSVYTTTNNNKILTMTQQQQQHNRSEIESLVSGAISMNKKIVADVTVLLHAEDEEIPNIKTQINSILHQTIQPKYIWILYNHVSIKRKLLQKFGTHSDRGGTEIDYIYIGGGGSGGGKENTNKPIELFHVRDAPWLFQHTINPTTQFTWIIEPNTIPDRDYLYYTIGLLKTKQYKSTLIGYETSLLMNNNKQRLCLQSNLMQETQAVDAIHGSWLLSTSWIPILRQESPSALDLPLSYFISSSLLYNAEIASIAIPSKLQPITPSSSCMVQTVSTFNSVLPNVMTQQKISLQSNRLVVLLDGKENTLELFPLLCKLLNPQEESSLQVHVVLTHGMTRSILQEMVTELGCMRVNNDHVVVHELTTAYNNGVHNNKLDITKVDYVIPVTRLLQYVQAQVMIQLKYTWESYFYRELQAVAQVQNVTTISLPFGQVEHAFWISDLSIEALQSKEAFVSYDEIKLHTNPIFFFLLGWNKAKVDLVVITDQRPQSLSRLLESANNAHYLGDDKVELVIHMEQSADIVTRNLVQDFQFLHGNKKVRHRIRKGGLMPAIVESWYPSDDHNFGVLLEDDIELSPFFYAWSKYNILKYRYSPQQEPQQDSQHIYGVSLYSPRNLELLPEGRRPFNPEPVLEQGGYSKRAPYATQIPCSWGAVYFPEHWREFHTYLTERISKEENGWKGYYNITVPGSRSERWKKSWKKYFIELVYLRAYVMVYPNFDGFESFSTNHLEYGTHVQSNGRTQPKLDLFRVPLMQQDTILEQLPSGHLPTLKEMPVMDLWGRIKTLEELDHIGNAWHPQVSTCKREKGSFDPSDLLCPFQVNVAKVKEKQSKVAVEK